MLKIISIHTSRTLMFSELEKVMDYSIDGGNFTEALDLNVTGKKSNSSVEKTARHLKGLYGFNMKYGQFLAFRYFWLIAEPYDKPLLAYVYAVNHDDLLAESIQVIRDTSTGEGVPKELFEEIIERYHPNQYSTSTKGSIARNIASSYKQAGFIKGKVKNIRVQPEIPYQIACFAFLLAYLKGVRGEFIWNSIGAKSLCLNEIKLRELAIECTKRDLMQYQFAGGVTAISFNNLLNKIGIDAI
jgi:hypothetical protein